MNKRFEAVRIARYVRAGVYGEIILTVNDGVIFTRRIVNANTQNVARKENEEEIVEG